MNAVSVVLLKGFIPIGFRFFMFGSSSYDNIDLYLSCVYISLVRIKVPNVVIK
jgi:hypothetical protein